MKDNIDKNSNQLHLDVKINNKMIFIMTKRKKTKFKTKLKKNNKI